MKREYQHLFGPVPSRRLGRSLGIDLTPFKTCSLDCIFCQLGRTTRKTVERGGYVPTAAVEAELSAWTRAGGTADWVTLAGSGEPTLHTRVGDVLRAARETTGLPAALLSNGTLFPIPEVRDAARQADVVKVSLSAWDQPSFERINRPHPGLSFTRILDAYRVFRREYPGTLWLEIVLLHGINSTPGDVQRIAALAASIAPDAIHLNTAVRPPAEDYALPVAPKELELLAGLFTPAANVTAAHSLPDSADLTANEDTILSMLRRRPCTADQIAEAFGMHPNEVSKYVTSLLHAGRIRAESGDREGYLVAAEQEPQTE